MKKIFVLLSLFLLMISFNSCTSDLSNETEYNEPPNKADSPYPEDGQINVEIQPVLEWDGYDIDDDIITYDIYFGTTTNPNLISSSIEYESYDVGELDYSTTYYWRVDSIDEGGQKTQGELWSFTTIDKLLINWEHSSLKEGSYKYITSPIQINKNSNIYGELYLYSWTEDYGIEILLMSEDDYQNFKDGYNYKAWHKSIYYEGINSFNFGNISPGYYRIIIDNSDSGWEQTDSDGYEDTAYFYIEAYQAYE